MELALFFGGWLLIASGSLLGIAVLGSLFNGSEYLEDSE